MGAHSILSPSSAYRWLACTPSARFEEQIPDEDSPYAAEGTLAHELAAHMLMAWCSPGNPKQEEDRRRIEANPLYNEEMYGHCREYVEYMFALVKNPEVFLVERSYDMSKYIPLQWGTCDASFVKGDVLHVVDFKYGAGVRVSATANKQLMCYALGAYDHHSKGFTINSVTMTIYQPRAGGASSWSMPIADLLHWAETEAAPKAKLAIAGQGDFIPGKHCQFCKARTSCKAYYDRFAELLDIRDSRVMSDDDVAKVLTYGPLVANWVKKVEEEAIAKLDSKIPVPGFKLVAGRGRRSFRNEDDVVDTLLGAGYESYQIFDPKLRSLTEIEKLVGPKRFKELFAAQITNVPGKPQIAPEDDERPPIGASAADEYDD